MHISETRLAVTLALASAACAPLASAHAQLSPVAVYRAQVRQQNSAQYAQYTNNSSRKRAANRKETPKKHVPDLKDALAKSELTPAQRAQIDAIQSKADADGDAAYSNRTLTAKQSVAKMQSINARMMGDIEATLTPSQLTRFNATLNSK